MTPLETETQPNRWSLVVATGLVVFMATLDTSVVTVALPVLQRDFAIGADLGQWVIVSYLLPLIAITLPAGRWIDAVGKRAAMLTGVAGFAAASFAVGAAPTFPLLLAARAAQGSVAGVLFALLTAMIGAAVRPEARGRAMGVATTLGPLGWVAGPAVGGVLTDTLGWPWIFWLNVPMAAAILTVVATRMPADGPLRTPDTSMLREFALLGAATAIVLVALTLTAADHVAWLALTVLAVPLVLRWWHGRTSGPVIAIHRDPVVRTTQLALVASSVAVAALTYLLPFFLQDDLGQSPSRAGLTLLVFPVAMSLSGPLGGFLADRWSAVRTAVTGGVLLVTGLALLVPLSPQWTAGDLTARLAVAGFGMGLFYGPNLTLTMAAGPEGDLGVVGAAVSLVRQLGFAAGPAFATVVWAASGYSLGGLRGGVTVAALGGLGVLLATVATARTRPTKTLSSKENHE